MLSVIYFSKLYLKYFYFLFNRFLNLKKKIIQEKSSDEGESTYVAFLNLYGM